MVAKPPSKPINNLPPLWSHQQLALDRAGERHALLFDIGCGKTRTAIELLKKATKNAVAQAKKKVLIFAPLNVVRNWDKEIGKYLGETCTVFLVGGQARKKKLDIIHEFRDYRLTDHHVFLVCNIEILRSTEYTSWLGMTGASFVIVDESHNFKSPKSLQTKGLFITLDALKARYLYLLSGTPSPEGYIDLWTMFTLLKRTTDNFFVWRKKYFTDRNERRRGTSNYWPDYVVTESGKEKLEVALRECSTTANKDMVLDLPPYLRTSMYAELSHEQSKHYNTMMEYLFAIDEDGNELNAANMLSRTLRLQQIIAGFLGDVPVKENNRLEALKAAIESTEREQFIVWTIFKATYKQIADVLDKLGIGYGMLTGEQTAEERFQAMELFQAGKIRGLIAHPKAGGVGVNLTAAAYSIHYTRSFSLTDDMQAEGRNYRGGSEIHKKITRIDIVAPDTIDEDITEALRSKKSVQDFILGIKEKHGR